MHKVDIRNDLMFSYVMRNPEICTELLEVLLPGHKIARVEYIELESERDGAPQAIKSKARKNRPDTQKALLSAIDKRGVRLDAYLDDGKTIYNIEMQTAEYGALPQRARLYQAHIDINQLERGQNFDELRPSYVIFICTFDPFGQSRYQYSFRNGVPGDGQGIARRSVQTVFQHDGHGRGNQPLAAGDAAVHQQSRRVSGAEEQSGIDPPDRNGGGRSESR